MSDPCAELQAAIRAALKGDPMLKVLFGGDPKPVKVYDVPPVNASPPYLVIGEDSVAPDLADCIDGAEVSATVHVWSLTNPPGLTEAKKIGAAVQAVLLGLGDLPSHRVVSTEPRLARYLTDADGRTAHGIVTAQVNTEPL